MKPISVLGNETSPPRPQEESESRPRLPTSISNRRWLNVRPSSSRGGTKRNNGSSMSNSNVSPRREWPTEEQQTEEFEPSRLINLHPPSRPEHSLQSSSIHPPLSCDHPQPFDPSTNLLLPLLFTPKELLLPPPLDLDPPSSRKFPGNSSSDSLSNKEDLEEVDSTSHLLLIDLPTLLPPRSTQRRTTSCRPNRRRICSMPFKNCMELRINNRGGIGRWRI